MLFKIFGKVQNYAKTIIRPNGPTQSWVAGHHPYDLQKRKYGRENSVSEMRIWFVSYLYRPGEWDGKEWTVQKIYRENESHGQKNQGMNTPEFHSSA